MKDYLKSIITIFFAAVLILLPLAGRSANPISTGEGNDARETSPERIDTLRIPCGDRTIFGLLERPATDGVRGPLAIISHGFGGTYAYGRAYFAALNAMGYQVFTFDFPCGSVMSRSGNNTMDMSAVDEKEALETIVGYFRSREDVDPDRIVLVGESQGGFVSALASAEIPDKVRALILVYPALCIPDDWRERYPEVKDIPDTTYLWGVPMGRRFFTEIRDIDVYDIIGAYEGPVLIVHGDRDQVVKMEYAQRAAATYSDARLRVISGAGHGFNPEEMAQALGHIGAFLNEIQ